VAFGELRFSAREHCRKWTAVKDRLDMRDLAVSDLVPLGDHYDALSGRLCLQLKVASWLPPTLAFTFGLTVTRRSPMKAAM
jgi:hypothetical protein